MLKSDGLPTAGFMRLKAIIGPYGIFPISKSSWWQGIRDGRYPAPVHLGARTVAWRVEDIRALLANPKGPPLIGGPKT